MRKFVLVLSFIFIISFAGAYSSSSFQYSQPGFNSQSSSFLSGQGIDLYGDFSDSFSCQNGQDFILQIDPAGCIPAVVRSDLLEEQNVPVFCPVVATKINPLINVDSIKYINFANVNSSPYISGVGFHPARAAVKGTTSTLLNSPVMNTVGYVVIVLKQEKVEANMPEYVRGELNAKITYDAQHAFGIGDIERYLPELTSQEWEEDFKKYSFWQGKFYLRVESIDENGAVVSIYEDSNRRVASVRVNKGETSNRIYLPGFYCSAGVKLRLVDFESSATRAKFYVDGDIYEAQVGQRFLDNKCYVRSITKTEKGYEKVSVSCSTDDGGKTIDLIRSFNVVMEIEGEKNSYPYKHDFGSFRFSTVKFVGDKYSAVFENTDGRLEEVPFDNSKEVFGTNIKVIGFEQVDKKISNDFKRAFDVAKNEYYTIVNSFEGEEISGGVTYAEKALLDAVQLASDVEQKATMSEMCDDFKSRFPNSKLNVDDLCKISFTSLGISSASIFVDGKYKTISFSGVEEVEDRDYSAVVRVNGVSSTLGKDKSLNIGDGETLTLKSLDLDSATFSFSVKNGDKTQTGNLKVFVNTQEQIPNTNYAVYLDEVNLKRLARVQVISESGYSGSEASLSYTIGIEKRNIELSPERTLQKIKTVNETIEKWSSISEKLSKTVTTLKAACLATGAALTVKNFASNLGGKQIARTNVMRGESGWVDRCTDMFARGEGGYVSVDDCLLSNSDQIDSDVDNYFNAMQSSEVTDSNRFVQIQNVRNSFSGDELVNPKDVQEKISIGSDSSLALALSESGYENGLVTDQEIRDLNTVNRALDSDPDSEYLNVQRYNLLKGISDRAGNLGETTTWSTSLGVDSSKVSFFEDSYFSKQIPYEGLKVSDVSKVNLEGVDSNAPVQLVHTSSGEKYIVVLEDAGNGKYPIKRNSEGKSMIYDSGGVLAEDPPAQISSAYFVEYDRSSYQNKYLQPKASYYETEPYKGLPAIVPFDLNNGWYAATRQTLPILGNQRSFDDSGRVTNFYICNVGKNGREQFRDGIGDDVCQMINSGTGQPYNQFPGLSEAEATRLVRDATSAVEQASRQYKSGVTSININGQRIDIGSPAADAPDMQCSDFMSPSDCKILFNVCDPVICPSSRCNLGGTYYVKDVIQTGIIGGAVMCLPNAREGIYIPVCLTGIQAGVDGLLSIYQSYGDCLQKSLDTGEHIGICDEIQSVYMCEYFWRELSPAANILVPKLIEWVSGQGARGGGEYLGVQSAWENAQNSVNYFTNYYGANSFAAFRARSTEDVGSAICKNFVSTRFPSGGDLIDSLTEPDSPAQFHAWFREIPFTSATVPATSQYKVFYHIYAGKDSGTYFRVYLKNTPGSSLYQEQPSLTVATGYIGVGEYATESKDFTAPEGYKELCVMINNQEECGFKEVSTSFFVNYVTDEVLSSQALQTNIQSESQCVNTAPAGAIVRVCSTDNPGSGTDPLYNTVDGRWQNVGYCGDASIRCWLDTESVKNSIEIKSIEEDTIAGASASYSSELDLDIIEGEQFEELVRQINGETENAKKIDLINNNYDKVILTTQKAKLIYMKAGAYAGIARERFSSAQNLISTTITSQSGMRVTVDLEGTTVSEEIAETSETDTTGGESGSGEGAKESIVLPSAKLDPSPTSTILVDRLKNYEPIIIDASNNYGVEKNMIDAIIAQESDGVYDLSGDNGNSWGLMQVSKGAVADAYNSIIKDNSFVESKPLLDPSQFDSRKINPFSNINWGTAYYKLLLNKYNNDEKLALVAYNWGLGNVDESCPSKKWESCTGIPNPVLQYVSNVIGYRDAFK